MSHRFDVHSAALAALCLITFVVGAAAQQDSDEKPKPADSQAPAAPAESAANKPTYELRYKLAAGETLRFEVTHRASIRSTIDQSTQAAQSRTDSVKAWKVTDVLPDGTIEFVTLVENVHMVNQLPEKDPIEYDSKRDEVPPDGFKDAARAVGVPLSVIYMTPSGNITRRDVKLRRPEAQQEDGPIAVRMPDGPVAVDDTWDEPLDFTVTQASGGPKLIRARRHFKLTRVENGVATIRVDFQVLSPVDAHIETQLVQRLMDGDVRFDISAGRVVSQQMEVDKRVLGFAGATSSMHYLMRMEEKLIGPPTKVADKSATEPATQSANAAKQPSNGAPSTRSNAAPNATRTATPPRSSQPSRGARRR